MLAIDNLANRDEITPQLLLLTHTPWGEFHCVGSAYFHGHLLSAIASLNGCR